MRAAVLELKFGADDKVLYGARNEYLAATRQSIDTGTDVDGDATDVVFEDLAFASVQPAAHGYA